MPRFRRRTTRRKMPVSWVWGAFDNTTIDQASGGLTALVLVEGPDWGADPTTTHTRKYGHLLRSIGRFHMQWSPRTTTFESQSATMNWAVFIQDAEDTDSDLFISTGANSILQTSRVIAFGSMGVRFQEIPSAQQSDLILHGPRMDWDVKARARMSPDDRLVLGIQLNNSIDGVSTVSVAGGLHRALIREP